MCTGQSKAEILCRECGSFKQSIFWLPSVDRHSENEKFYSDRKQLATALNAFPSLFAALCSLVQLVVTNRTKLVRHFSLERHDENTSFNLTLAETGFTSTVPAFPVLARTKFTSTFPASLWFAGHVGQVYAIKCLPARERCRSQNVCKD